MRKSFLEIQGNSKIQQPVTRQQEQEQEYNGLQREEFRQHISLQYFQNPYILGIGEETDSSPFFHHPIYKMLPIELSNLNE